MVTADVLSIEILHNCIEKGVALIIHLDGPLDVKALSDDRVEQAYIVENEHGGFFRFTLCGFITITGVLNQKQVRATFIFFRTAEALPCLEGLFPGAEEAYVLRALT